MTSSPPEPERPLVSVIIPAHNLVDYVGDAIESALAQTYPALEVIVVDDGSTDGTRDVVERYRPAITFVTQPNGGPSSARNAGLRLARGEIIGLLDGDDTWLPERVERLVDLLNARPDLDLVTSDSWVMDDVTPTTRRSYPDRRKRPFPSTEADQIPEIAQFNFLFVSVLFRRRLLDRCGDFTEGARRGEDMERRRRGERVRWGEMSVEGSEDYDLWMRFLISGARAGFLDEPLGYYRVRPGSVSQSGASQARAHLSVLERNLPALWKQGARASTRDTFAIASSLTARGERRRALPYFFHAVAAPDARGQRARLALMAMRRWIHPSESWIEDPLPRGTPSAVDSTVG